MQSEHLSNLHVGWVVGGWLIAAAGPVYLTGSALRIMTPDASAAFAPAYLIAVAAELAFAATLLARGYRFRHAPAPASAG